MRFDLDPNFVGQIKLNVTPFAVNIDGSRQMSEHAHLLTIEVKKAFTFSDIENSISCKICFQVEETNDAPKARPSPLSDQEIPIVPFSLESEEANVGFFVKDLMREF